MESNPVIFKPVPKSCSNLSVDSLVILFLRLLVTTSPIGSLFAKETAAGGLSFSLSLSCCGYKSVTFWLYFWSVNSSTMVLSAFKTNKW